MDAKRRRDEFEIAIICALTLESDAVEALLLEEKDSSHDSYGKAPGDRNIYTIGRLGRQRVVLAHMPGTGINSATAVAYGLRLSFEKIKVAFVVGVCGGVPVRDGKNDIHLGDVIISTQVVQIDFGRQYQDGIERKREVEDVLGRADPEIRAFVQKLRGYSSRARLREETSSLSAKISSMEDFASAAYPGAQHDIVYAADYQHKHRNTSCQMCDGCKTGQDKTCKAAVDSTCNSLGCEGKTAEDVSVARKPAIHFGRIACGNQVIKSGTYRDKIATEEGVVGFEMESAGPWDYVPTIVVKGVCDYADSHKSKKWQRYAAVVAAACTKAVLDQWTSVDRPEQGSPSSQRLKFPVHQTIPRLASTLFTGRREILNDLKSDVQGAIGDRAQSGPCHIVITGMGGQGKSEICLQLIQQVNNLFWGIFWVDVSTKTLAENGFLDISARLGLEVATWQEVKQELANLQEPWLLVLDNADDLGVDYQQYFPTGTRGVVLLTSRNVKCEQYATKRRIDLEGLTDDDALELLYRAAHVPVDQRQSLETEVQAVAYLLRSHALAIVQAGSYISCGHCSLGEYPHRFEQHRKRLMTFRPSQARSEYQDVYATFEASADILQQSATTSISASDALQLLSILAMFGPNRLPVLLFEKAWEASALKTYGDGSDDDLLTLTSWHIENLPEFVRVGTEVWDSFRFIEATNLLKEFSLISVGTENSTPNISMHPLVHAWARDRLDIRQQHAYWVQASCAMVFSGCINSLWINHTRQLQPHLQAITSWKMSTVFNSNETIGLCRIMLHCGYLLLFIRDDKRLLALMKRLSSHLDPDRGTLDPRWAGVYELFGTSLLNSGLTKDAIRMLEQTVKIRRQTRTEKHSNGLTSQRMLAAAYLANGQRRKAISMLEHVLNITGQTLAEDDPSRLISQHVLAEAYLLNGQNEKAKAMMEHVLKSTEQTLSESHPDRLTSQEILAVCLWNVGDRSTTIDLQRRVVNIRTKVLDQQNPLRINSQKRLEFFEANMKQR